MAVSPTATTASPPQALSALPCFRIALAGCSRREACLPPRAAARGARGCWGRGFSASMAPSASLHIFLSLSCLRLRTAKYTCGAVHVQRRSGGCRGRQMAPGRVRARAIGRPG